MTNSTQAAVKAIAFHLPQFHPIPENDVWWGKGFTEWTNVTRTAALFPGHWQPHLPSDLGFYDLRLPEVHEEQARLARRYNIHGFCYYHYWLHGKRLLELPVNTMLRTGRPNFPFCLCWANHNWTRKWDDGDQSLLVEQRYSMADHLEHIRWLARVFQDERYIRIDGKPLFLILRASAIPSLKPMVELWREQAHSLGVGELYLAEVESQYVAERVDPRTKGLDGVVEFQPDFPALLNNESLTGDPGNERLPPCEAARKLGHRIYDYATMVEWMQEKTLPDYPYFRCVTPSWDNTARRKRDGIIIHGSTPELYRDWLADVVAAAKCHAGGDRFIFLNAWNEWAEGNHLEPCQRWGHEYLHVTRRVLAGGVTARRTRQAQEVGS
jgi:lipopolysaccharide biosynthesis protein